MKRIELTGHDIRHTGSAVDDADLPTGHKTGPCACECGERSEDLPGNGPRRAWHRSHVAQVYADLIDQ